MSTVQGERSDATTGSLGTFGGVFTPSVLTILGLVLFLRVGFVVGSVGLVRALLILALATSVSVLTSISLSVVATNMKVRGGGEYFLISRTLGIEFGGAVGVVLYLAISVSIAFYAIGFAEAVTAAMDVDSGVWIRVVAAVVVLVLTAIGIVGADLATRLQYVVMVLLVLALGSFFVGAIGTFDAGVLGENVGRPESDVGFWEAFAIFFPAVTGFSQGVAMSGDLRNPSKSITRGTFAAVGLSTVIYVAVMVLLAGGAPAAVLAGETATVIGDVSALGWTMLVGVLAATLSSALASTLGGPRVLQRLGEDRVLPRLEFFAVGAGPSRNPRRAIALSTVIALGTVAAGDINTVAPVISMFFLASYGIINYATYYEIRAGSTSFRPRFRWYSHRASLAGTIACVGAIVAINPLAGSLAALVFVLLYNYLRRREVPDRWTDSSGSHHYTRAREHLHALAAEPSSDRDWRPCMLAFVPRDPTTRSRMVTTASWLEGGSGFTTAVRILEGSGPLLRRQADEIGNHLEDEMSQLVPPVYARVVLVRSADTGVQALVQSHGLGTIRPNLALFGMADLRGSDEDRRAYGEMLQSCIRFGANVAVLNVRDDAWARFEATPPADRSIALWWSDDKAGQLITLLGWLSQRHADWERASITVYVPSAEDESAGEAERVEQILDDARITAGVVEVDRTQAQLLDALGSATLALAPLRVRRGTATGPFGTSLGMLVESLPLAVMVLATEMVELDAEPDEGELAEFAKVSDQAKTARKWVADLDAEAAKLLVDAEALRIKLDALDDADTEARDSLEQAVEAATSQAAKAYRKYVDARARSAKLEDRVAELDPTRFGAIVDPEIWRGSTARRE